MGIGNAPSSLRPGRPSGDRNQSALF
jgi:hypothetical protein